MNRFERFTDLELVALEATFTRIAGGFDGVRGKISQMLNEVYEEVNRRKISPIGSNGSAPIDEYVTGTIWFKV